MAWLLVVVAGLLETGFAVCLKLSHGFTRLWPTIAFACFALGSFGLLTLSLKKLDVGPAYAVWTGIGAAGTAIYGMVFLGDITSVLKIVSMGAPPAPVQGCGGASQGGALPSDWVSVGDATTPRGAVPGVAGPG
nr:multidrug efflux SMR transporter [Streptomyces rimosus]